MAGVNQGRHQRYQHRSPSGRIRRRHRRRRAERSRARLTTISRRRNQSHRGRRASTTTGSREAATSLITSRASRQLRRRRTSRSHSSSRCTIIFTMIRIIHRMTQRMHRRRMMDRIDHYSRTGTNRRATPVFNNSFLRQRLKATNRTFTITLFRFLSILLRNQNFFRHIARMRTSRTR